MKQKEVDRLVKAALIFGGAYLVLSHPRCGEACRSIFAPLTEEAGKAIAASALTALLA